MPALLFKPRVRHATGNRCHTAGAAGAWAPGCIDVLTKPRVGVLKRKGGGGIHDVELVPFENGQVGVRPSNCMRDNGMMDGVPMHALHKSHMDYG